MSNFEVRESPLHGRGCFATRKIIEGEKFTFPVLVVKKSDLAPFIEMTFPWSGKSFGAIVIGPFTFCNSTERPNMKISSIDKDDQTKTFTAIKNISAGEEVTLFYPLKE
jgi:hypothetical protein